MADLNKLEDELDDLKIAREIEMVIAVLLKNFHVPQPFYTDYPSLEKLLADFYIHIMANFFGVTNIPETMARGFVSMFLKRSVGIETAADMAKHGLDGGVYKLLENVAQGILSQLKEQHIEGGITGAIDVSDYDDRLDYARKYLAKYHPGIQLTSKLLHEVANNAEAIAKQHMQIREAFRKMHGK